jgi:hypothetical protein
MKFSIKNTIEILERTPNVLHSLLYNVGNDWTTHNEGGETWSPYDVIGHLIHCDEYSWLPRIEIVLSESIAKKFDVLDRFAQFEKSKDKNINQLLDEFITIRLACVAKLKTLNLTEEQLSKIATHPDLGSVTLSQLISAWTIHDLDHLSQISRVMAKQYKDEVGPWIKYFRIINN